MTQKGGEKLDWLKVLEAGELPEGRVKTVACRHLTLCMTHFEGRYGALDNRCPHQGGPLGEGSIENGLLRCPWHGWDYDPISGKAPGFDDGVETYPVEVKDDGIYVGLMPEPPRKRTVSDVMAETMVRWGVRCVFGMVGHSNLGLADALRVQTRLGNLTYIGIRHEGAASFAASAYGKLTGRPAACLSIAGPGATNLLTGLWDANVDRSPVLALTGQVDTQVLGPGAFQEIDLQAAFGKVAQWSQPVLHSSNYSELMNLACKTALVNRGVSHLIFPDEVQKLPAAEDVAPGQPDGRVADRRIRPSEESLAEATDLLLASSRPVIIVGHGARFHMDDIIALAEALQCPVITTFKAKGQVSDHHPLGCGVLGRSGTPIASYFMNEADVLVVLGASFSNHTGITDKIPTVQIDLDPIALGRFQPIKVPVWGDIGVTAPLLLHAIEGKHQATDQRAEISKRWAIWRSEKASRADDDRGHGMNSASIFSALSVGLPDDAIIAVDVGNNTYSFGRYFECNRQTILMSGYLGSIGFAYPAAMGAWSATQETDSPFAGRRVISISGDGGFGQYMGEFNTAVKYNMDIVHVILNNSELGKISKEQRSGSWPVWETSLRNPSFAAYAKICGGRGWQAKDAGELKNAIAKALAHDGPSIVEAISDKELI